MPGELLDEAVVESLRSGHDTGTNIPDAADNELKTLRVVAENS